jgi:hypothetical protein
MAAYRNTCQCKLLMQNQTRRNVLHMITDEKIAEVQEMLAQGFSYHFIYKRTGVSRPTISNIATGKCRTRAERALRRSEYAKRLSLAPREYSVIINDAIEALVKAGRMKRGKSHS